MQSFTFYVLSHVHIKCNMFDKMVFFIDTQPRVHVYHDFALIYVFRNLVVQWKREEIYFLYIAKKIYRPSWLKTSLYISLVKLMNAYNYYEKTILVQSTYFYVIRLHLNVSKCNFYINAQNQTLTFPKTTMIKNF